MVGEEPPLSSSAASPASGFNQSVGSFGERLADRIRAFARPWELASFVWVPAIVLGFAFWYEFRSPAPLQDYGIFRAAASAVLHGRSPFVAPTEHALAFCSSELQVRQFSDVRDIFFADLHATTISMRRTPPVGHSRLMAAR